MEKIRLGVIGCGAISLKHLHALSKIKELILVSVCDIIPDNALSFRENYIELTNTGYRPEVYTDYRDMIQTEKLDMVSILTDSGKHFPIAMDCLNSGINVLVEKPLALTLEEVDKLTETARRNKLKLGVSHQHRFNTYISLLKEAVDSGRLGELFYGVTTIRWNRNKNYFKSSGWRGTLKYDGGILMNQCIHNIDLLQWLLGEKPIEVFAYSHNYNHPYIETEDTVLGLIKFQGGISALIEGTISVYPSNLESSIAVFGKTGSVKIGGSSLDRIETWVADGGDGTDCCVQPYSAGRENYHALVYRDFIKSVQHDREPMVNGYEARKTIEIILALKYSSVYGLPVKLPLKEGENIEG